MASLDKKRKPRPSKALEPPLRRQKVHKDAPKTSAVSADKPRRSNLTMHDWLTVFAYCDKQPKPLNQTTVTSHFQNRKQDALFFTQPTLSHKLGDWQTIEARATSFPNALSSHRIWVVTHPDIEAALGLWVDHMHDKGEAVNRSMLFAKWQWFEDQLEVPESERLTGMGWIMSFCKA